MVESLAFLSPAPRLDDKAIMNEQRHIPPIPPTCSVIKPKMTEQIEGCNDFSGPTPDACSKVNKITSKPPKVVVNSQSCASIDE